MIREAKMRDVLRTLRDVVWKKKEEEKIKSGIFKHELPRFHQLNNNINI